MNPITPEAVEAAYVLNADHAVVEDGAPCMACADDLEEGQQALDVREPAFDVGQLKAVITVHLKCYQGEELSE